ncbi:hypothetical protein [Streptomyces sp. NPDC059063]|uniref:hypothetical protein n=1 Tax=unclassified Streptomyces TaxID=2593676 RepID=UPI003680B78A
MGELLDAAVGFPGVAYSSALAVVLGYWALVAVGLTRVDSFDEDADLRSVGLGGVPVSVAASLLTLFGWGASVAGSVAVARAGLRGMAHAAVDLGLLLASALVAWGLTRVLVRVRVRRARGGAGPSPRDFIGSVGTVRTGWVDAETGRAEVATKAGSVAIVEVRRDPSARGEALTLGSSALLYAYDETGEFFWAQAVPVALTPGRRAPRRPPPVDRGWPQADCA